jgi:hypothetical protein
MEKRKKYECPIAAAVTMDNTNPLLVGSDKSGTVRKDYQNEDVGTEGVLQTMDRRGQMVPTSS